MGCYLWESWPTYVVLKDIDVADGQDPVLVDVDLACLAAAMVTRTRGEGVLFVLVL